MKNKYTKQGTSKKRYGLYLFGVLLAAVMMLSCVYVFALDSEDVAAYSGGTGTEGDPYQISNRTDLEALATQMNSGESAEGANAYYKLTADIDLSDSDWTPISAGGYREGRTGVTLFAGTFDGDGHKITGLRNGSYDPAHKGTGSHDGEYSYGLFGIVSGATIKNLTLENVTINTGEKGDSVGAIVGYAKGNITIQNCSVTGTSSVSGLDGVGGLIGRAYSSDASSKTLEISVTNCSNAATVTTNTGGDGKVAGILGFAALLNSATVTGNTNTGTITNNATAGTSKAFTSGIINLRSNGNESATIMVTNNTNNGILRANMVAQADLVGAENQNLAQVLTSLGDDVYGTITCNGNAGTGAVQTPTGSAIAPYNGTNSFPICNFGTIVAYQLASGNLSYCVYSEANGADIILDPVSKTPLYSYSKNSDGTTNDAGVITDKIHRTAMNGTVTLDRDYSYTDSLLINRPIILDMNGHTITYGGDWYAIEVYYHAPNTKIINGTVSGSVVVVGVTGIELSALSIIDPTMEYTLLLSDNNGGGTPEENVSVTIKNGSKIIGNSPIGTITTSATATVIVNSGTFSNMSAFQYLSDTGTYILGDGVTSVTDSVENLSVASGKTLVVSNKATLIMSGNVNNAGTLQLKAGSAMKLLSGGTFASAGDFTLDPGYYFVDWNSAADGSGNVLSDTIAVTSSLGADAYFIASNEPFTVTIVGEGVTVKAGNTPIANGDKVDYGTVLTATIADKTGYTKSVTPENVTVTANVEFVGIYTPVAYVIAFNANEGTGTMANLDMTYDVEKTLTAVAFTREGYAFGGWATSATGVAVYSDKATVKNLTDKAETVTLYAVWIKVEKTDNSAEITVTTDAVSDQAADQLVEAAKEINNSVAENVTVDVKATETESVAIKSDSVKDAVDSGIGVNIATSKGAMEFSPEALKDLVKTGETLKSEIKQVEVPPAYVDKVPADTKVFSISLTSNDVAITSFGAAFTVRIAYAASGNTDNLYVAYLAADGTLQKMDSYYEDGYMVFTTDHLSDYAILEDNSSSGNNQGLLLAVLLIAAIVLPIIAALIIFKKE